MPKGERGGFKNERANLKTKNLRITKTMLPYKTANTKRARKLRRKMTGAEKKIWSELLRKDKLEGFRFLRQKPLDNFIADFY